MPKKLTDKQMLTEMLVQMLNPGSTVGEQAIRAKCRRISTEEVKANVVKFRDMVVSGGRQR